MIISKEVDVVLNSSNIKHYKLLGYNIPKYYDNRNGWKIKRGTIIKVKIQDLPIKSTVKILCKCENCETEKLITYHSIRRKDGKYFCHNCCMSNLNTLLKLSKSHLGQIPWNKGKFKNINEKEPFEKYLLLVRSETKNHLIKLWELFDGYCYYTKKKLINNEEFKKLYPNKALTSNLLQPTVDHKISIYYGFKNNIDYKVIGNINNLCICARYYNSVKGFKINK